MSDAPKRTARDDDPYGIPGAEDHKLPRSFLAPYLLLPLRNWNAHGYEIMRQMMMMGFAALDPGMVYRVLRHLEKEGMLRSRWDTSKEGPARRIYSVTDAGLAFLQSWAASLEQHRRTVDRFFELYSQMSGGEPKRKES
ncbi:MAG: helix-turn-helix transcriptional regulator [Chloroflexi bacterium]|nr:helix-turn-helix transcriptional regulator [Chloroflexota bacterium]